MAADEFCTDSELLVLLKSGDHRAYRIIYDRFWALLYRHAFRMLEDENLAKDIVQDVFTNLWMKREQLELRNSLSAFLYAAVRNGTLNQLDHSKVRSDYIQSLQQLVEEGEASTDLLLDEKELARRIEAELAQLPEKMRKVFELSRLHDYSYKQIAEELQVSDHTVKKQVSNALRILRSKITFLFTLL